jgi:hypothetical protein
MLVVDLKEGFRDESCREPGLLIREGTRGVPLGASLAGRAKGTLTESLLRGPVNGGLLARWPRSLAMVPFRAARATRREMGGEDLEPRGSGGCQM